MAIRSLCIGGFFGLVVAVASAEEPQAPLPSKPDPARDRAAYYQLMPKIIDEFESSPHDALFLEGTLARLSSQNYLPAMRQGNFTGFALLHRLAERKWHAPRGESADDLWVRLQKNLESVSDNKYPQYRELLAAFPNEKKYPAPLDWRANDMLWRDLFVTLRRSLAEKDPATIWREKIRADEKYAALYRLAYAAAAIATKSDLDLDLALLPTDAKAVGPNHEFSRVVESLHMLGLSNRPTADPVRAERRARLVQLMETLALSPTEWTYLLPLDALGGEDQRVLRAALVRTLKPRAFQSFAGQAKIPPEARRRLYLAKEIKAAYHGRPLGDVLRELQSAVEFPLWVDKGAVADKTPILLVETGPWLVILDHVLSQTKYSLEVRPTGEFWIGAPERKRAAFALWDRALFKAANAKGKLRVALHDPTILECINTPIRGVLNYLSDLHHSHFIFFPPDLAELPITNNLQGVPLYLALELLAERAKLSWEVVGDVVVFGTPAEFERLRQFESRRLRLLATLAATSGPAGEKLVSSTAMQFDQTPLNEVCAFLSDVHRLPVAVAAGDSSRKRLTLNLMHEPELGPTLDITAVATDLFWSSDGEAIYFGSQDEVSEFLKLREAREKRRATYSKDIAVKLQSPIKLNLEDLPVAKAAANLSEMIGLPVELPPDDAELPKTSVRATFFGSPPDVALDLICLAHRWSWQATEKGVLIRQMKP